MVFPEVEICATLITIEYMSKGISKLYHSVLFTFHTASELEIGVVQYSDNRLTAQITGQLQ